MNDELQNYQISQIEEAIKGLVKANAQQQEFNLDVVRFMSSVATWGKGVLVLWTLGQGALLVILTKALA